MALTNILVLITELDLKLSGTKKNYSLKRIRKKLNLKRNYCVAAA